MIFLYNIFVLFQVLLLAVLVAASTARPQFGNPVAAIRNFFDERTANGYRFG